MNDENVPSNSGRKSDQINEVKEPLIFEFWISIVIAALIVIWIMNDVRAGIADIYDVFDFSGVMIVVVVLVFLARAAFRKICK